MLDPPSTTWSPAPAWPWATNGNLTTPTLTFPTWSAAPGVGQQPMPDPVIPDHVARAMLRRLDSWADTSRALAQACRVPANHVDAEGVCPICRTTWPCAVWVEDREQYDAGL